MPLYSGPEALDHPPQLTNFLRFPLSSHSFRGFLKTLSVPGGFFAVGVSVASSSAYSAGNYSPFRFVVFHRRVAIPSLESEWAAVILQAKARGFQ
jgi:hypothetical protein